PQILMELSAAERRKICAQVKAVIEDLQWMDAAHLIHRVMANPTVRGKVLGVLTNFFKNELKAQIKFGE
ncbi:CS012 protein, partial [Hippolais icterina]|nr:CS012 protein [Hippolais icterina]